MKTAIVISDTHGNINFLESLDRLFAETDYIIHLGDTSGDGSRILKKYPDKCVLINGNCDIIKLGEDEKVLEIEGVRIFACHGHRYGVKQTLARLADAARRENCTIALYGHTHRAREDKTGNVTLLNPGTGSRYSDRSYLYLVIDKTVAVHKIVHAE